MLVNINLKFPNCNIMSICALKTLEFDMKIWDKLQTNTNPQIISLVSNVSKLFRKLASQVQETRFCKELEHERLDFAKNSA